MAPDPPGDSLACSADLQPSALPVTHDPPLEDQAPAHTHHSAVSHAQPGPAEQGRSEAPSPAETPRPQGEREGALAHAEGSEGNTAGATTTATPPRSPAQAGRTASASPSTPTRSSSSSSVPSSSSASDQSPSRQHQQQHSEGDPTDSAPHSSSPTGAADSSPSSSSTSSNRSPSSSPASGHSHAPPSRRVKVYRLKEDAWIDLGTGTCAGVFLQASSSAGEEGDEGGEGEGAARREVREEDEGAWIVVRREGGRKREGSPTKGKGSAAGAEGENAPMLGEGGEGKEGGGEGEEEDDADDSIILRTRVQPYPPGYSDDLLDSDEEVNSLDENGNATIDAGGYQRQQDTLIVWTERGGGVAGHGEEEEMEMALSFATSSGCSEMWEFIKAARRFAAEQQALHSPSPSPSLSSDDRAFPAFSTNSTFSSLSTLPEPSLGNLATLEAAIRAVSRTTVGRERAANIIVRSGFVDKLVKVHEEAEDLESLEDLHALCRVMQTIFLLNDSNLFDLVIKDDLILGVVGMLEYDPDFPTMRASYRAHLSSPSSFVSVVPPHLLPPALLTKIHHTHRLHYLKDVVLARVLEDSTFSMLNSHIYFNEVDIVNEITGARELVREVFRILEEGEEDLAASSSSGGGAGGGRGRERAANPAAAKGKERELGPKRTLGPELPDDLLAARKKARVDSPPSRTSISFVASSSSSSTSSAAQPSPSSSSAAALLSTQPAQPSSTAPSPPPPHLHKLHATLFLAQLAQMAKNLQLPMRTAFYKTLCDRGLLGAIEGTLRGSERIAREAQTEREGEGEEAQRKKEDADAMRGAALGLWMAVVDLDAPDVRAYCLRQGREVEAALEAAAETEEGEKKDGEEGEAEKREKTMLGVLIEMFKREEDLGVRTQLAEALRVLVDVAGEGGPLEAPPRMRQEDPEAEKFLQYFYDHCMLSLVQPLMDLPERKDTDPPLDLPPSTTALLSHICDLLCFFISHHTFRSKYLVLSNPLLAKSIARLLRPRPRLTRHTHLRLAALRFIRAIVARTDDFYNRFLIKHDLIRPVLETADEEKEKDNLLGSACLEFFEYLRTTNAKALLNHLMDRSGDQVRLLARGNGLAQPLRTFDSLIARWEMNNEPPPLPVVTISAAGPSDAPADVGGPASASMQRERSNPPGWSPRMELEEESYFDASDEEDDAPGEADSTASESVGPAAGAAALASASFGSSRRKRGRENTHNPLSSSSSSSSAVGETAASAEGGSPKRAKLEGGRTGPLAGLVDYVGEDDSDDEAALTSVVPKVEPEDPATAGGFIRERRGAVDAAAVGVGEPKNEEEAMEVDAPPTSNGSASSKKEEDAPEPAAAAAPPPLLSLGELKRKKEEDEDGELGLLAKKKAVSPSTSSSSPPTSAAAGKPAPSSASTAPKPGGFKIALSGFKAKFGGGKEKEKEK
ncbi:hypothetical protein JCM8097_004413 [Rhodosporidiobolus ruineniae]